MTHNLKSLMIRIQDKASTDWEPQPSRLRTLFSDQPLKTDAMHLVIRTDNGSQFTATEVAKWMEHMGMEHEFIHAATPK